jgi:hypothetical protein
MCSSHEGYSKCEVRGASKAAPLCRVQASAQSITLARLPKSSRPEFRAAAKHDLEYKHGAARN